MDSSAASFFHGVTYENMVEPERFPDTKYPIWILGKEYLLQRDYDKLIEEVSSKILFTYRKGFSPIGGMEGPTTDYGWGCMIRCGQMMLAQALVYLQLGREWRWTGGGDDPRYYQILSLFKDIKSACYSIHQIANMGASEGKSIGEWFGPNTILQVLRKLTTYDRWTNITVHIAMDNIIVLQDIHNQCRGRDVNGVSSSDNERQTLGSQWRPLLLFLPLRLGLTDINPVYFDSLKKFLSMRQSVGIIGGKPNHAYWFIGYSGDKLYYLDPHVVQSCVDVNPNDDSDRTFHVKFPCCMDVSSLDPSVGVGFFCATESEFDDLCRQLHKMIATDKVAMFEIHDVRPVYRMFDTDADNDTGWESGATAAAADFTVLDSNKCASEDEFEIL